MPIDLSALKPCDQRWDRMRPVDGGRLCARCDKRIVDFRRLRDDEIAGVHLESEAPVCGVYSRAQLVRIGAARSAAPRAGITLAAAVGAALLATDAAAQAPTPAEAPAGQAPRVSPPGSTEQVETEVRALPGGDTLVVRGTIRKSYDGAPANGVMIGIKGTRLATVTGADGRYLLPVPARHARRGVTLVVMQLGYERQEMPVRWAEREATVDAELHAAAIALTAFYVGGRPPSLLRRIGWAIGSIFR